MRRARLPGLFQLDDIEGTQKPTLPSASLCGWDADAWGRQALIAHPRSQGRAEQNQSP